MKFAPDFYLNGTFEIAEALLGAFLCSHINNELTGGRIVEVEVYLGVTDKASHAYGGRRTERTAVMYRRGGIAYIYLIYGIYSLLNVVTGAEETPHAILIRALEPVTGIGIMMRRRKSETILNLTSGPGKLCEALGLTREQNGSDLTGNTVWIEAPEQPVKQEMILRAPRVGIDYAEEFIHKPWRFFIKDNPFVSKIP